MSSDFSQILSHFQAVDPIIAPHVAQLDLNRWRKPLKSTEQYFVELCDNIISQQLGTKVAAIIVGRFFDLFPERKVTAEQLLALPDQTLRDIGLSWAKIKYVKDLAEKTKNRELAYEDLPHLDSEAVITELTKVKGIGRWTVEMFLMFALGRDDVFSHGDFGLKRGIKELYNLPDYPSTEEAEKITHAWKPYRSYGSFALWESLDKK